MLVVYETGELVPVEDDSVAVQSDIFDRIVGGPDCFLGHEKHASRRGRTYLYLHKSHLPGSSHSCLTTSPILASMLTPVHLSLPIKGSYHFVFKSTASFDTAFKEQARRYMSLTSNTNRSSSTTAYILGMSSLFRNVIILKDPRIRGGPFAHETKVPEPRSVL